MLFCGSQMEIGSLLYNAWLIDECLGNVTQTSARGLRPPDSGAPIYISRPVRCPMFYNDLLMVPSGNVTTHYGIKTMENQSVQR